MRQHIVADARAGTESKGERRRSQCKIVRFRYSGKCQMQSQGDKSIWEDSFRCPQL
jgi:hypothetical protein